MNVLDVCTNASVLRIILYIEMILKYVFILLPIGLILMLVIDISKNVIAGNEEDMKKNLNIAIKRIIYAVVIFFIPTIVSVIIDVVNNSFDSLNVDYSSCLQNVKNIEYYEALEQAELDKEESELMSDLEEFKKERQEKEALEKQQKASSQGNQSSSGEKASNYVDFEDLTKISGLNKTQLTQALESSKNKYKSKYEIFIPLVDTYVKAEREYSVNLLWLLPEETAESGWGVSTVAKRCNNLGGVFYAKSKGVSICYSAGKSVNGKYYFAKFSSRDDFIMYQAKLLHESYLVEGGTYYEGKSGMDVLIHYWGIKDVAKRTWYVNVVKDRAQAIIDAL